MLEQDGNTLYQEKLPLEYLEDSSLRTLKVDWRLKSGGTYRLRAVLRNSDKPVYALVSMADEGGLAEFGGLEAGGNPIQGQLLAAINYRSFPFSKKTILFLTCTWMGILGSAAVVVQTGFRNFRREG